MTRKPGKHIVPVTWYCRKLSLLGARVVGAVTKHPSMLCICMFRNNFSCFVMSCDLDKTTKKRNGWQTGAWNCNNMDTCVKRVAILMVFTSVVLCQGAYRKLSLPFSVYLPARSSYNHFVIIKKTEKVRNLKNNKQAWHVKHILNFYKNKKP